MHFIARGATLDALRSRGLTVVRDEETFAVSQVRATADAKEVGLVDLALVTTKSYDLEGAAQALQALKGPDTIVMPLQNGVDIAERLAMSTGPGGHVLGGLTYLPASGGAWRGAPGWRRRKRRLWPEDRAYPCRTASWRA